jgi:signal transduction histidine kinase
MSRQWKERLERQNHLFEAALSNMQHGLSMFDREDRLILCNTAYARMYSLPPALACEGTPRAAIVDHCIRHGCAPADMTEYSAIVEEANTHHRQMVRNILLVDGRVIKISLSPVDDHTYVTTHLDVTEKVRVTEELARANDTLEAKVRERTALIWRQAEELERLLAHEREINDNQRQFVTMASHEFRTPLTVIDGAAQRLLRRQDKAEPIFVREKADVIRASVTRLVTLIESMLASGRHDAGEGKLHYEQVDLATMLRQCCDRQASIAAGHRFHITADALPPSIECDRSALEQVFTNLLSNAVKYSPQARDIHVETQLEDDIVHVSVRDQGVGIDAEDLPRMFQRYFRARTATGIAGTGLGLYLVRQIVEMHQGVVEVASRRGAGTTFTIRLPVSRSPEARAAVAATIPAI